MTVIYKPKLLRPCVIYQGYRNARGYGRYFYKGKPELAHRVAYIEHHGLTMADIAEAVIMHKCDNPGCIEPTHLEKGTCAENNRDRELRGRGRQPKGKANGKAKLIDDDVIEIRRLLELGVPQRLVGARYGISQKNVFDIKHRNIWTHV